MRGRVPFASRCQRDRQVSVGTHTRAPRRRIRSQLDGGLPVPLFTKHLHQLGIRQSALFLLNNLLEEFGRRFHVARSRFTQCEQALRLARLIGTQLGQQTMRSG
ncbi:hypothetical protein HRbin14_01847 [bacterium HR14]|nr:hypothetical protein HRbin14_01847 [bacterium HR14]